MLILVGNKQGFIDTSEKPHLLQKVFKKIPWEKIKPLKNKTS